MNCADEFRLGSLYSDGVVLRSIVDSKDSPYIWGYAEPGTMIEVTLATSENAVIQNWYTESNTEGYWGLKLKATFNLTGEGYSLRFASMSVNGTYLDNISRVNMTLNN